MQCEEVRALINPAADSELSTSEAALVSEHLNNCLGCSNDWDKVLKIRSMVKEMVDLNPSSLTLEERLLTAIDKEEKSSRRQNFKTLFGRIAVAAVMVMGIGIGIVQFSNTSLQQANVDVSKLVAGIGHHSDAPEDPAFSVKYMGHGTENLSDKLGFKLKLSSLGSFSLYGADIVTNEKNKPFLRLCYTNEDDTNCIDCYQAPHGMLTFGASQEQTVNGKQVRLAKIGNQSVVMINDKDIDVVYASPISQDELLKLVAPNV